MNAAHHSGAATRFTHVSQGEFAVSGQPDTVITTILGSCVATTLYDPVAGVGGMNHFLLPEGRGDCRQGALYGVNLMELLINGLLRLGARKDRLQAKLFGGARIVPGLSELGDQNARFARGFLNAEDIPCLAESLGGTRARRIRFWPTTNRARQILIADMDAPPEIRAPRRPAPPIEDDVELF